MYKKMLIITAVLLIFSMGICLYFIEICFGFEKNKKENVSMQIIRKDDFIFELELLSQRELSKKCMAVDIPKNKYDNEELYDLAYPYFYVFGSVQYVKNNPASLIFKLFSLNNKTFSSPEININVVPANRAVRIYFLCPVSFVGATPYTKGLSKEETILGVEIKEVFLK